MSFPFRENVGLVLRELRRNPEFASVSTVPWQVFVAIALHLQRNGEAWPSQETLGVFCGYAARTVRTAVAELERRGLLRVRREREAGGLERLWYAPGPVAQRVLAELDVVSSGSGIPDPGSGIVSSGSWVPDPGSGVVSSGSGVLPSGSGVSSSGSGEFLRTKELLLVKGEPGDDRDVARSALSEYFERRFPDRPPPPAFDDGDVERVARCAAAVDGDAEAKLRALRDAIEGAFRASTGAPTVRFIFERKEHFLKHVERGRRARSGEPPARASVPAPVPAYRRPPAPAGPRLEPKRMAEDLDKLFGPGWRTRA